MARVYPVGAAREPITSEIHIPFSGYPVMVESREHLIGVEIEDGIVVPAELMRVHEDGDITKLVIVIDDVCQIYHDLVPFIFRWLETS
jgi:hypothetical protein